MGRMIHCSRTPNFLQTVTSDFIHPLSLPLPSREIPGFAPRGEKKSLAYGTWKDSYSLVYVFYERKNGKKRKKEEEKIKKKNTSSPELSIPSDLSLVYNGNKGRVKRQKKEGGGEKKKKKEETGEEQSYERNLIDGGAMRSDPVVIRR